jgi:hypothetical protein
MELIERPHISTKSGSCRNCGSITRSHVISPTLYMPYTEEVVVERASEYATKQWIETEEVTKYEVEKEAVVMCHKCWMEVKVEAIELLSRNIETWNEDVGSNLMAVKSFIKRWGEHGFGDKDEDEGVTEMVRALKLAIRRFARGE